MGGSAAVELANGAAFIYALPLHQAFANVGGLESNGKGHASLLKSVSTVPPPGMALKNRVRVWLKNYPHVRGEAIF